jgi:hypothetical protein
MSVMNIMKISFIMRNTMCSVHLCVCEIESCISSTAY